MDANEVTQSCRTWLLMRMQLAARIISCRGQVGIARFRKR